MNEITSTTNTPTELPATEYLSKYGMMRKHYLQDHMSVFYAELRNRGDKKHIA